MVLKFLEGYDLFWRSNNRSLLVPLCVSLLVVLLTVLTVQGEPKPAPGYVGWHDGKPGSEGWNWKNCCGRPCRSSKCVCDNCICYDCPHREHVFGWLGWTWKQENLYNEGWDDDDRK